MVFGLIKIPSFWDVTLALMSPVVAVILDSRIVTPAELVELEAKLTSFAVRSTLAQVMPFDPLLFIVKFPLLASILAPSMPTPAPEVLPWLLAVIDISFPAVIFILLDKVPLIVMASTEGAEVLVTNNIS
ncbi:Uncharacterised protein [Yersinia intermedia]|nr:Uncharacterised protein [Yersinia intermedia]